MDDLEIQMRACALEQMMVVFCCDPDNIPTNSNMVRLAFRNAMLKCFNLPPFIDTGTGSSLDFADPVAHIRRPVEI